VFLKIGDRLLASMDMMRLAAMPSGAWMAEHGGPHTMATSLSTGFAYDAAPILGLGSTTSEPLPEPESGLVIIRYGGWSPLELRDSRIGRELLRPLITFERYDWAKDSFPAGLYRLRIPVPNSNCKSTAHQEAMLPKNESSGPMVLLSTALLCHYRQTGEDLQRGDFTRCREKTAVDKRVELRWRDGHLVVDYGWDVNAYGFVWLSSVVDFQA
jgi:hypothetical protein